MQGYLEIYQDNARWPGISRVSWLLWEFLKVKIEVRILIFGVLVGPGVFGRKKSPHSLERGALFGTQLRHPNLGKVFGLQFWGSGF